MENIIEQAWIELSQESVFYSYLRLYFDLMPSETVKTIKLNMTPYGKFRLIYNERKLISKGLRMTKGLIKHEIYHIIFGHIFIKPKSKRDKYIWDLCMDAAINQYIKELDTFAMPLNALLEEGCGVDNDTLFVTAPMNMINKTAEEYFDWSIEFLKKLKRADLEESDIISEKRNEVDSHDFEFEAPEEMVFDIVSEVLSQSYDKSSGDVPSGVEFAVSMMIKKPKFSWQIILRRFFGSSQITDKYTSLMRPNRRYEEQPGWLYERGSKVVLLIDTSGSIIDEEYNDFFSEIESISKLSGGKVTIVQADEQIQSVREYTRGDWKNMIIKGKGSTELQPVTNYIEENLRPEGIIIFTDGYVELPVIKRRVLFVLSKNYNPQFYNEAIENYGKDKVIIL